MKKINCIIIDDEELARSALKLLINKLNCQHSSISIEVLSECKNTSQALKIIPKLKPDFIFLDINMPNQSGLEMLSDLPKSQLPLIIFVTAYSEYAIQGFETNAVDYLMKPVSMQRLAESINRVHERMKSWAKDTFIIVKDGSRKLKLQCKNIISIQAAGNYMCIKTFDETLIQRITLQDILSQLSNEFIKINRSSIVNTEHVKEISSIGQSRYELIMYDGQNLKSSAYYRAAVTSINNK